MEDFLSQMLSKIHILCGTDTQTLRPVCVLQESEKVKTQVKEVSGEILGELNIQVLFSFS